MRFSNICDSMNVTGCTEQHLWEQTGTGLSHFMYIHQIEIGIVFGLLCVIGLIWYSKSQEKGK